MRDKEGYLKYPHPLRARQIYHTGICLHRAEGVIAKGNNDQEEKCQGTYYYRSCYPTDPAAFSRLTHPSPLLPSKKYSVTVQPPGHQVTKERAVKGEE